MKTVFVFLCSIHTFNIMSYDFIPQIFYMPNIFLGPSKIFLHYVELFYIHPAESSTICMDGGGSRCLMFYAMF